MRLSSLPSSERSQLIAGIALVIVTGVMPDLLGNSYWSLNFQLVNIIVAAAVFQNLLMNDAGQISFGQGAIFGVGAYVAGMAAAYTGMSWSMVILVSTLSAGAAGLLFALPALRVQGYYLGFVTLSAATVFPELLFVLDRYTNGINGVPVPVEAWKTPLMFGITPLTVVTIAVAALAMVCHVVIRHSAFGRKIKIAGASPEAAQTLGIRPGAVRSIVFVIVCAGTGVAGALYAPIIAFVTPAAFHLDFSILLFLAVIVGGRGQIIGPLTGVYLLYLLPNVLLVELIDYRLLAYGVLALGVMLLMPDGIVGTIQRRFRQTAALDSTKLNPGSFPVPPISAATDAQTAPVISVRGATKVFGAVKAMDNIDLDIERGTIVGLVGGNGSGKTTLLNAVTGFNRLSGGTVTVRDQDICSVSPASVARLGIGRTFQTPRIFETLTAWENVLIGKECPLRPNNTFANAELECFERELGDAGTTTIPHGQRRSMELFRVMLTGADVLLLDEPAAGLSAKERKEFSTLLLRLKQESGKTILFVEHDLDLVWGIADKIAVMDNGKLVACGAPQQLMADPAVKKLFVRSHHA
jgi:branched-chain amino acid transport system permease protein